jgi:tetratricopeptide (TPR) repeat protein
MILFATAILLAAAADAALAAESNPLAEAIAAYEQALGTSDRDERRQRFHTAEILFRQVIAERDGDVGPDLYVNLGNAALQAEHWGPAIAAFRTALRIDPTHERAAANLHFARSVLSEWVRFDDSSGIIGSMFVWRQLLNARWRSHVAAGSFLASALLWAMSLRTNRTSWRTLAWLALTVWLLLTIAKYAERYFSKGDEAVVIVDEVVARSADSAASPSRFPSPLPGGTEVTIVEQRSDWVRVRIAGNQTAWLPISSIQRLSADGISAVGNSP